MTTAEDRIHLCPPAGSAVMPCCARSISELTVRDRITSAVNEVTCTDRAWAELVVDQDGDENPFGWREDVIHGRAPALAAALCAVRRQCKQWSMPTAASTWDARNRDLGVAVAAGVLIEVIDRLAPGLDDPDADEAAQRPGLVDRFAAVLASTLSTLWRDSQPLDVHTHDGRGYDARCALCTGDVEALAVALAESVTRKPLPHLGSATAAEKP